MSTSGDDILRDANAAHRLRYDGHPPRARTIVSDTQRLRAWFATRAPTYTTDASRGLWAWVRRREAAFVHEALGDVRNRQVLELGCGTGFYARQCLTRGAAHVVAVDITPAMVHGLPPGIEGHVGDAATFDAGRTVDHILCAGALEFVADPGAVLANARRHAHPGTRMAVLAPRRGLLGRLYRWQYATRQIPIHLFTRTELTALARAHGWAVDTLVAAHPYALVASLTPAAL